MALPNKSFTDIYGYPHRDSVFDDEMRIKLKAYTEAKSRRKDSPKIVDGSSSVNTASSLLAERRIKELQDKVYTLESKVNELSKLESSIRELVTKLEKANKQKEYPEVDIRWDLI